MNKRKEPKIRMVFDVVNSVKGGSGKSTFSLLLASYYAARPATRAYILDLDLRGTSWELNYSYYLKYSNGKIFKEPHRNGFKYINQLMYDNTALSSLSPFVSFQADFSKGSTMNSEPLSKVLLCMSEPGVNRGIDDLDVDLFENAVFRLIDYIYESDVSDVFVNQEESSDTLKEVHIVFDMPPSYEAHAERIVKHLLLDINSPLYKKILQNKGAYSRFEPYILNLYMIASVSPAHISLNVSYVGNLLRSIGYSSNLLELYEGKGEDTNVVSRFFTRFVCNDIVNTLPSNDISTVDSINSFRLSLMKYMVSQMQKESYRKNVVLRSILKKVEKLQYSEKVLRILPHMEFSDERISIFQAYPPTPAVIKLPISFTDFEQLIL